MKEYILDSYALIAYFQRQPGHEVVASILEECAEKGRFAVISVVNWGEVVYHAFKQKGEESAQLAEHTMNTLPLEVVDADRTVTREAARLKATKRMSYADCFAAALTKTRKAELVTGDKEFKQVEGEIKIRWL